jgi:hypothetical protein
MDEIVRAALAKWPDVPHCYGWLALDARGQWRMRDERCQALNLRGDIIRHPALTGFINRNYQYDENGCWYFQNGPQRVYVDLMSAPYIVHLSEHRLMSHTGTPFDRADTAYFDAAGNLFLLSGKQLAQLDDRDLAALLSHFYQGQTPLDDAFLLECLSAEQIPDGVVLRFPGAASEPVPVAFSELAALMARLSYQSKPRSQNSSHQ